MYNNQQMINQIKNENNCINNNVIVKNDDLLDLGMDDLIYNDNYDEYGNIIQKSIQIEQPIIEEQQEQIFNNKEQQEPIYNPEYQPEQQFNQQEQQSN